MIDVIYNFILSLRIYQISDIMSETDIKNLF